MINLLTDSIVWLHHGKYNEIHEFIAYKLPFICKAIGDYASRYDPDDKLWGTIHVPSGMRVKAHKTRKPSEILAIHLHKNMVNSWNGIDVNNQAFLDECRDRVFTMTYE